MAKMSGMLLSEWLRTKGEKRSHFAARIGVSATVVTKLCQGKQWLNRDTALKIERATEGEVTAADFVHVRCEAAE